MLVGAVIGRPCEIRKGATDDRPYEEYDGRQKPLLEERCHEVTERWQMRYNESRGRHVDVPCKITVGATIGRPLKKTQKGRPMIAPTKATL